MANPSSLPTWLSPQLAERDLPVEQRLADLRSVADLLAWHVAPAARRVSAGLRAWLEDGGDLAERLGVNAGRGGVPLHRRQPLSRRDDELRRLAGELEGSAKKRAQVLAQMVLKRDPRVVSIEVDTGIALPASSGQLARILRSE